MLSGFESAFRVHQTFMSKNDIEFQVGPESHLFTFLKMRMSFKLVQTSKCSLLFVSNQQVSFDSGLIV